MQSYRSHWTQIECTAEVPAFAREEARFGLDAAIQLGMFGRNAATPKLDSLATRLYPRRIWAFLGTSAVTLNADICLRRNI